MGTRRRCLDAAQHSTRRWSEPNMPESVSLLMLQFLDWIATRRRTYAEAMEAWRSSCPRLTVWEDALADGLIQFEGGSTLRDYEVTLSARGRAMLEAGRARDAARNRATAANQGVGTQSSPRGGLA
jgi:hypothetical protein